MRARGLPHLSFPAALGERFIAPRHGVVVVGTHGKTTTSAMMGRLLHHAGRDPSFLVGGVTRDFESNYRLGGGPHFVVEGDEYDTAYFDKGPKFLHYQPRTAILTSCELDHADIYRDEAHYQAAFERFVALLPGDGFLAACASYPSVLRLAARAALPRRDLRGGRAGRPTGRRAASPWPPTAPASRCGVEAQPLAEVHLPVGGAHNVENALGVAAAATRARALAGRDRRRPGAPSAGSSAARRCAARPAASPSSTTSRTTRAAVRKTLAAVAGPLPGRAAAGLLRAALQHQPAQPAPARLRRPGLLERRGRRLPAAPGPHRPGPGGGAARRRRRLRLAGRGGHPGGGVRHRGGAGGRGGRGRPPG